MAPFHCTLPPSWSENLDARQDYADGQAIQPRIRGPVNCLEILDRERIVFNPERTEYTEKYNRPHKKAHGYDRAKEQDRFPEGGIAHQPHHEQRQEKVEVFLNAQRPDM